MKNRIPKAVQDYQKRFYGAGHNEGAAGLQEAQVVEMLQALSKGQRDRLQGFLEVILASKEGQATEADVVRCILGLPQEDIQPFTDILQAIGSRNK